MPTKQKYDSLTNVVRTTNSEGTPCFALCVNGTSSPIAAKDVEPTVPEIETRYNNAAVKSICPVCNCDFKPPIGETFFLVGTWDPVCCDCTDGGESQSSEVESTAASQTEEFDDEPPF